MQKPHILLYEAIHERALQELKTRANVTIADNLDESTLIKLVADVDGIIIRANGKVSRKIMEAAPKLKVVGRHGVGIDAIDLQAAADLNIAVVNTPEANLESVAEQCVGMMINLAKMIGQANNAFRSGDWNARYRLIGTELYCKTLGVVGFGRIGQRVAEICHLAFNMPVIYSDVLAYPEAEQRLSAQKKSMDVLAETADFVSVHAPLIPATRGLIGQDFLSKMKPSAFLINSSRGPVVDQNALLTALQENRIAGAGLDVFDPEPFPSDHPLLKQENLVVTPHMAAHTDEALYRMALVWEDLLAIIEDKPAKFQVALPEKNRNNADR